MKPSKIPRVVIVGANFAGLKAAAVLSRKVGATVVDPWPWFEFLPNIHELVSGFKTPEMLRLSKQTILRRAGHTYVADSAVKIDPLGKKVITDSGKTIFFDYCLVAIGGKNNTYNVPGADTHAMSFKTVDDCHAIGLRLKTLADSKKSFSIVIAGGGLEGIETLGEILRKYHTHPALHVHVVETRPRLLDEAPADVDSQLRQLCKSFAVDIHTGASVRRVGKQCVELTGGAKLPSDLTIWTGGAIPPDLLHQAGLAKTPECWAPVNSSLQSLNYPNVFIIGDAAGLEYPLSKQAYHALDMGKCAAENILRLMTGHSLQRFNASSKPQLISFGDLDAYMITESTVVGGAALNVLKEAVFQMVMAQFDPAFLPFKIFHISERAATAGFEMALPMLFSPESLARLKNIRIIR